MTNLMDKFYTLKNTEELGADPIYPLHDKPMIDEFLSITDYYSTTERVIYYEGYLLVDSHDYDWIRIVTMDSNSIELSYTDYDDNRFEVELPRTLQGAKTAKFLFNVLAPPQLP